MPVSRTEAIGRVGEFIRRIKPKSLLDIGIGFGAMGVLFRELMDIRFGRYKEWETKIDGVEIFEGYRNPIWKYIYDNIFIGDASEIDFGGYDVIFLGDVIEHFPKEEALALLKKCYGRAKYVVVTTPIRLTNTENDAAVFGNSHEKHLSLLEDSDFPLNAQITHFLHQRLIIIPCKILER